MLYQRICVLASLLLFSLFFQSCSDDFDVASSDDFQATENARLGGQGNNQGGNQGGRDSETEVVTEWMDLFLELDRYATGMRPNATARAIAYINMAAYETALPEMRGYQSNDEIYDNLVIDDNYDERNLDISIALNEAYSIVIDHFILHLPDDKRASIETQREEILSDLTRSNNNGRGGNNNNNNDDEEVEESEEWGAYVANQVIAFSQTDAEAEAQILAPQPLSYVPPVGDGFWTFSAEPERALFPYWESVRTFAISPDETTTVDPLAYSENTNSPYYQQMVEVYEANNAAKSEATDEDAEQLWIAEFWSDDIENLMFSPPARQISIANQLVIEERMDLDEALYLYLKVGYALNDAAVSTWKYKYEHMVMRPSVFIQDFIDADYQTNLFRLIPWPNPTFPAYPSGHSTFASAAAGVFIDFFGDSIDFTDESHEGRTEFRGTARTFDSFSEMADENGYSRIPLGVHMRMDCTEGLRLGYEISDGVNQLELRRQNL